MIRFTLLAAAAALVALAGCSTPEEKAASENYRAPVYRTGSNLPAGRETGEPAKELSAAERRMLEDMQNQPRKPIGPAPK